MTCWPMEEGFQLTSPFGPRDGDFHYGQDFGWEGGSGNKPVYAAKAGTVDKVGPASGFGQWVCVDHPEGGYTVYGHVLPEVVLGETVAEGQRIAHINPDSNSNGGVPPHLHMEVHRYVWSPPGPNRLDPIPWLDGAYYPGQETKPVADNTFFADVSYFQAPVDDSYPYKVLSIRSNDGTFEDANFEHNYQWCVRACDDGRLACFIVYAYWRSNWDQTAQILMNKVEAAGGPHPKMIVMNDLESGGNPGGDQSAGVNGFNRKLRDWLGNARRVITYANSGDFYNMWRARPDGERVIGAGYGSNPNLPGQIAHQYTDGEGFGGGLPEGAPPFGNCDMNVASGMSPEEFAAECGVGEEFDVSATSEIHEIWEQLRGPDGKGWAQLGKNDKGQNLTLVDAFASVTARLAAIEKKLGL